MAQYMSETLPSFDKSVFIVHVPTATARIRQRGYDQAELIAKNLARTRKLKYSPVLARLGQTRQVGAKRSSRLKQMQNAFYARKPQLIKGSHIILVDDVTTTGATLEAAARVLKLAGAKTVAAITFAQKQ
jgi:ComF family protein